jgi:hypothetical protein
VAFFLAPHFDMLARALFMVRLTYTSVNMLIALYVLDICGVEKRLCECVCVVRSWCFAYCWLQERYSDCH